MRSDDGKLLPDPALVPYVEEMFRRRADGATIAELARWLKDELVHAPRGGSSWSHSTIAQVLRNRVYLGEQKHGKFQKQGAHAPILTEAEFDAAQVAKPMRAPEPKAYSSGALLPGLARCETDCGHTLKIVVGYGGRLRYYCKGPYTSGPVAGRVQFVRDGRRDLPRQTGRRSSRLNLRDDWARNWRAATALG